MVASTRAAHATGGGGSGRRDLDPVPSVDVARVADAGVQFEHGGEGGSEVASDAVERVPSPDDVDVARHWTFAAPEATEAFAERGQGRGRRTRPWRRERRPL